MHTRTKLTRAHMHTRTKLTRTHMHTRTKLTRTHMHTRTNARSAWTKEGRSMKGECDPPAEEVAQGDGLLGEGAQRCLDGLHHTHLRAQGEAVLASA